MNFELLKHTVLLCLSGSRAYGTESPTSDWDIKGVCIPPLNDYLGITGARPFEVVDGPGSMTCFEHLVPGKPFEGSVLELRKFMRLALVCNPNILEVLYCRPEDVLYMDGWGRSLREVRDLCLSRDAVRDSFSGYVMGQIKRIRHRYKQSKNGVDVAKDRNDARADLERQFGYDTKHAMHVVRLYEMGREVLRDGVVRVHRGGIDDDLIRHVRNGGWKYEQFEKYVEHMEAELAEAARVSVLPDKPDLESVSRTVEQLLLSRFEQGKQA